MSIIIIILEREWGYTLHFLFASFIFHLFVCLFVWLFVWNTFSLIRSLALQFWMEGFCLCGIHARHSWLKGSAAIKANMAYLRFGRPGASSPPREHHQASVGNFNGVTPRGWPLVRQASGSRTPFRDRGGQAGCKAPEQIFPSILSYILHHDFCLLFSSSLTPTWWYFVVRVVYLLFAVLMMGLFVPHRRTDTMGSWQTFAVNSGVEFV